MNAIQEKVLHDCIKRLNVLGVAFAIVDLDGVKHGDLELADPKEPRKVQNNFRQHGYAERVDLMGVGDVEVFCTKDIDEDAHENYRSSIMARGIRQYGRGSMMSTFNAAGDIEVMRVS